MTAVEHHTRSATEQGPTTPGVGPETVKPMRVNLGGYSVTRRLGKGGSCEVFEGSHILLGRRVALKVLSSAVAADRVALERFGREARAAARLNHPNVVAVYDVGNDKGRYYLSMELLDFSAADALARRGALPWREAARIVAAACKGLGAAHRLGLVHRDVKPGNIMCGGDGSVKVTDFGLVTTPVAYHALTLCGEVVGTPEFMSPEQCTGAPVDHRSDIYSLGATFYNLLTDRFPFESENAVEVMTSHVRTPAPDATKLGVPEGCAAIIRKAMAKDPADRYQTADEMFFDIQRVAQGKRPVTPPAIRLPVWFGVAATLAASVAAAIIRWL